MLHVLAPAGAQVVEDQDLVAAMDDPICEVGADKAGATGD